jgi:hypothetical protein
VGAVPPRRLEPGARPFCRAPEKLKELQELFLEEARKYNVLPLDLAEAAEDVDHLVTPEERLLIAMGKQ